MSRLSLHLIDHSNYRTTDSTSNFLSSEKESNASSSEDDEGSSTEPMQQKKVVATLPSEAAEEVYEDTTKGTNQKASNGASSEKVSHTTVEPLVDLDASTKKSENMKFLNKVLSDVQELITYEKDGKHSGNSEGKSGR